MPVGNMGLRTDYMNDFTYADVLVEQGVALGALRLVGRGQAPGTRADVP